MCPEGENGGSRGRASVRPACRNYGGCTGPLVDTAGQSPPQCRKTTVFRQAETVLRGVPESFADRRRRLGATDKYREVFGFSMTVDTDHPFDE